MPYYIASKGSYEALNNAMTLLHHVIIMIYQNTGFLKMAPMAPKGTGRRRRSHQAPAAETRAPQQKGKFGVSQGQGLTTESVREREEQGY